MNKIWFCLSIVSICAFPAWCAAQTAGEQSASVAAKPAEEAASKAWQLDPVRVVGGSSMDSGARLMDPVLLDFDGDGLLDIVFGAPGYSPNGVTSAGSIYVVCGKKDQAFEGKIDVTSWDAFDYRIDGYTPNGQFGIHLLTGDFNGDGFKDLAAAEPGQKGAMYLFYGGKKREKGIYQIGQEGAADVAFVTTEQGSNLGIHACVGDFDRNGIDDLAMSWLSQGTNLGNNASQVTILTMRSEWDKDVYDIGKKIYGKTVISRPVSSNSRVVHTCATGDFNDDGVLDIALGMPLDAYQKQKSSGSVTVIYHPHRYNGTVVDIAEVDEKIGVRMNGNQTNAQFGYSLAAGDFTGDGRDDLAVSAPNRLIKGPKSEGMVYIFDANHWPKETSEQPAAMEIPGKGGQFGFRLSSADVNGDKRADLVISAPTAGTQHDGALMAYLGGPHFVEVMENGSGKADIELQGEPFMGFGLGAAFGDINGDGKVDAVVRTSADPIQRAYTGALTTIGAFQDLPQTSVLSDKFMTVAAPSKGGGLAADMRMVEYQGKSYRAWFSPQGMGNRSVLCLTDAARVEQSDISVSSAAQCDVQIVGPENYEIADFAISKSPTGKPWLTIAVPDMRVKKAVGFVAVIEMPESIDQPLVLNLNESTLKSNAQTFILEGEDYAELGKKVEWRDLDGDGFDDLIIGAPKRMIDNERGGSVFIVRGNATRKNGMHNLMDKSNIVFEGFINEELGSQWQVLDFNLDGQLDLLVRGEHTEDASGDEYATVYGIYSAGKRQPKIYGIKSPELSTLRIITPQHRAGLEIIPQVVDLNGDGYEDFILMAPEYRAGLQKQGIVYALFSHAERKSGELKLSDESHIGFSFIAGRNERIVDARFARVNGQLEFIVVAADLTTSLTSFVSAFVDTDPNVFIGNFTASRLVRTVSEARLPKPVRLIHVPDTNSQHDELWMLFPHDGVTQSGQGIAQKVVR